MTKKSIKIEVNNFVKGIVTEASPLNFPANASLDESNFILNRDGTRNRRLGFDFESNFSFIDTGMSSSSLRSTTVVPYKWTNVAGRAEDNFLVIQIKNKLHIYNMEASSITSSPAIGIVDLSSYSFTESVQFSFATVEGKLVVVAGSRKIVVVTYSNGVFSVKTEALQVRDVWGVEVVEEPAYESDVQYRGKVLHPTHNYNLYNQSWGLPRQGKTDVEDSDSVIEMSDPVSLYFNELKKYPSNSETVWPGLQFQPVSAGAAPYERIFPELYSQVFGADIKSAKGYFVIDVLNRGSSRAAKVASNSKKNPEMKFQSFEAKADYTPGGATFVCEFAGRVFYSGFGGDVVDGDSRSPSLSNYILFSQLVKNTGDIAKCYQEGDPTSRDSNDLVDTDGGFIRLSGAETIHGMLNISEMLVVFASNGVWIVSGGSDFGFSATNYKVEKISSFGAMSRNSIVEDGSRALYWSEDGIYAVTKDQLGSYSAGNITQTTIQKLYESIPTISKKNVVSVFDSIGKRVRWLYNTGERFTSSSHSVELVLDLTLGAFYKLDINRLDDNSTEVIAPFSSVPYMTVSESVAVMANTDYVVAGTDTVKTVQTRRVSGILDTRYLCAKVVNDNVFFTIGTYSDEEFLDWKSSNGEGKDAKAFVVTGATTGGDSSLIKQAPYLFLHFYRTEKEIDNEGELKNQSSCLVQSQWDWSTSRLSNKWSPQFQAYRYRRASLPEDASSEFDSGFELVTTKNKLRGRGRAFALRLETEPLRDCQIVGWNISLNGNAIA